MQVGFDKILKNLNPGESAAIAVSGGADSMALCLLAFGYAKKHKIRLHAVTVDHGLRKEAPGEALQVAQWLEKYKIKHTTLKWEGVKPKANIQALARNARYGLLHEWCMQNKICALLVAHNANDQAETFLLRLKRGSGLFGLAAIAKETDYKGLRILRPLLDFTRPEIEAFLKSKKQPFINDPSNENIHYDRVKARKFLPQLDEFGITVKQIADTVLRLQGDRALVEAMIDGYIQKYLNFNRLGFIEVEKGLFNVEKSLFLHVLGRVFLAFYQNGYPPEALQLERLYEEKCTKTCTLGGLVFYPYKSKVLVAYEYDKIKNVAVTLNPGDVVDFLEFKVRSNAKETVVVKALGDFTSKEIKKSQIPAVIRRSLPAVYDKNGCHPLFLGHRDFGVDYTPYSNYIK